MCLDVDPEPSDKSTALNKCEQITLTRKTRGVIAHNYSIKGEALTRVDRVKDLGIVFDQK